MKRTLILLLGLCAAHASSQDAVREKLLASVRENNPSLKAGRELLGARSLEARTGNTLPNPTVGYDYLWGSPADLGKTGELNVVQGFDFPTLYASRRRLAGSLAGQYSEEYGLACQQTLLEADMAYIDYLCLKKRDAILRRSADAAAGFAAAYARKAESGEAGALDVNKAEIESMNARNALKNNDIEMVSVVSSLELLNGGLPVDIPAGVPPGPLPALPVLEELKARYLAGDPRLAGLRRAEEVAGDRVGVARGSSLPKFEVGYRREHALGETFSGVKMGVSIPVFEGRHAVQAAKAMQRAAGVEAAGYESRLAVELNRMHAKAALLLESYNERAGAVSPEKTAALLNKALETGYISVVDYFVELRSLMEMELALVDLERDYRKAVAGLLMVDL